MTKARSTLIQREKDASLKAAGLKCLAHTQYPPRSQHFLVFGQKRTLPCLQLTFCLSFVSVWPFSSHKIFVNPLVNTVGSLVLCFLMTFSLSYCFGKRVFFWCKFLTVSFSSQDKRAIPTGQDDSILTSRVVNIIYEQLYYMAIKSYKF